MISDLSSASENRGLRGRSSIGIYIRKGMSAGCIEGACEPLTLGYKKRGNSLAHYSRRSLQLGLLCCVQITMPGTSGVLP